MTIVDHDTVLSGNATEGWECFGVAGDLNPILRPIAHPVDWPDAELHLGIFRVEVSAHGDAPLEPYVKVIGTSAKSVYETWRRVNLHVGRNEWMRLGEPF